MLETISAGETLEVITIWENPTKDEDGERQLLLKFDCNFQFTGNGVQCWCRHGRRNGTDQSECRHHKDCGPFLACLPSLGVLRVLRIPGYEVRVCQVSRRRLLFKWQGGLELDIMPALNTVTHVADCSCNLGAA